MSSIVRTRFKSAMWIRLGAAAFAGGIAVIVLFSWAAGHRGLADLTPGFGTMNPMTAILCGLTALALTLPPRRPTFLLAILTITIVSLATAKLAQILLGLPFGIDQFLVVDRSALAGGDTPAGVALASVLLSGGLLAGPSSDRRAGLASQLLCAVVIAIALLAAVGYGLQGLVSMRSSRSGCPSIRR